MGLIEAESLNEYTVVLYDQEPVKLQASKYDTEDKEDWIVFYGPDNQPVAEFPRWNIQGLYIGT